jgi:predicted nucleic acid-binding protein
VITRHFVRKSANVSPRRIVIVDAGPLKAAIDRSDVDHAWAERVLRSIPGRFVTSEAAIAEAQHGLENHPVAVRALRRLVGRMNVVAFGPDRLPSVFDEIERWAPRMDFADGCAVVLARSYDGAFVLTTDFRDFATYGVPFASPEGAFHT